MILYYMLSLEGPRDLKAPNNWRRSRKANVATISQKDSLGNYKS